MSTEVPYVGKRYKVELYTGLSTSCFNSDTLKIGHKSVDWSENTIEPYT